MTSKFGSAKRPTFRTQERLRMGRPVKILLLKLCVQHQRSNTPRFKFKITKKTALVIFRRNPRSYFITKNKLTSKKQLNQTAVGLSNRFYKVEVPTSQYHPLGGALQTTAYSTPLRLSQPLACGPVAHAQDRRRPEGCLFHTLSVLCELMLRRRPSSSCISEYSSSSSSSMMSDRSEPRLLSVQYSSLWLY